MTDTQRSVLITGAAGRIGSFLAHHLVEQYHLTLTDIRQPEPAPAAPFTLADTADLDAVRALCQGVDTVVHMAADPRPNAPWEDLLPRNIVSVYNIFQAAHEAGCRRVIWASSINAVAGYPQEMQVRTDMPVRPLNLYGATKAWGEAVACYYADQRNLSAICLRFGWVMRPEDIKADTRADHLVKALTYEDLTQLVAAAIDAPDDLRFGVFQGVSNNRFKRLDISDARATLGYAPRDDAFALFDALQ